MVEPHHGGSAGHFFLQLKFEPARLQPLDTHDCTPRIAACKDEKHAGRIFLTDSLSNKDTILAASFTFQTIRARRDYAFLSRMQAFQAVL